MSALFIGFGSELVAELFGTPRYMGVESFIYDKGFFNSGFDVVPKLCFIPVAEGTALRSWLNLINYDKVVFCVRHPYPTIRDMHPVKLEAYEEPLFEGNRGDVLFTMGYYSAHVQYSNVLMHGLDAFHQDEDHTRWVKYERLAETDYLGELSEWLGMEQTKEFEPVRWRFRGNTRLRQLMKLHKGVNWICQELHYFL